MRITDRMLNRSFMQNVSGQKAEVEKLRTQIASQKRVEKPSDDPKSAARIINLSGQFESANRYIDNVSKSITYLNQTTTTLESIMNEVSRIDVKLTEIQNSALDGNQNIYANEIGLAIDSLLELANQKFDGKYLFGGTDYSDKPYDYATGKTYVKQMVDDLAGDLNVKVSPNLIQKINVSGAELFGTVVKVEGNLDENTAVGIANSDTQKVYDADGNEYTLSTIFTKTAANTYKLSYDVTDSSGASVLTSKTDHELVFDSKTKTIKTIDDISPKMISINDLDGKLNFNIDVKSLTETENSTQLDSTVNQKRDIFNVLLDIKKQLESGDMPDSDLVAQVKNFHEKVLGKLSEVGSITNRLIDTESMLQNQQTQMQEVIAKEQEVDVVDAISKMQYYDYVLQMSYKMSSMILPKSILDYL